MNLYRYIKTYTDIEILLLKKGKKAKRKKKGHTNGRQIYTRWKRI